MVRLLNGRKERIKARGIFGRTGSPILYRRAGRRILHSPILEQLKRFDYTLHNLI